MDGPKSITLQIMQELFERHYPKPRSALYYNTPFQLLVATILSAQTTDKQVNKVTGRLFKEFPLPGDYIALEPEQLARYIKSIGLYRNKSKQIIGMCRLLVENFGGEVPSTREELMTLPGVGRKTANVVLSNAFHIPAFAVDTHVARVALRLGLTANNKPEKIEKDLCRLFPPANWLHLHRQFILHGRALCQARSPRCPECFLIQHCPFFTKKRV